MLKAAIFLSRIGGSSASWLFLLSDLKSNMAFVCISIVAANLTIIAWSVVSVGADMTFTNLFDSVKVGKQLYHHSSQREVNS